MKLQLRVSTSSYRTISTSRISTKSHESSLHANQNFDSYSPFACMLYLCDIIFIFNWTWFVFVHVKTTSRHTMLYLKWWFSHFLEITCINEKSRKAWEFRFYEHDRNVWGRRVRGGRTWRRRDGERSWEGEGRLGEEVDGLVSRGGGGGVRGDWSRGWGVMRKKRWGANGIRVG